MSGLPQLDLRLFRQRRAPVILQTEAAECGLAALAMVASALGCATDLNALRRRYSPSLKGTTLHQLMRVAAELRLSTRAVRLELHELPELRAPAILHWDLNHFVVLERATAARLRIIDPACGRGEVDIAQASRHFTGVALELTPADGFEEDDTRRPLKLRVLFTGVQGLAANLLRILLLSLALQVFALVSPFYSQLIVDDVIASHDVSLLLVLLVGFGLLSLIKLCVSLFRSWVILYLGTKLNLAWVARLFHHLLRLPLEFFEKRHVGDIVSRFGSIKQVQQLVTTTAVEAIVDGIMAVTTLLVMFVYSPMLSVLVLSAVLLYGLLRLVTYGPLRTASQEALVAGAQESSNFMETVRAMQTVKCFSGERMRESAWQNAMADAMNAQLRVAKLGIFQSTANRAVFAAENLLVLYFGALAVIGGGFSLGMLMAFLSYKSQFTGRGSALIDKAFQYRMISLHLERLADIVQTEAEPSGGDLPAVGLAAGSIEARALSFRYGPMEPPVLDQVDLVIHAGECVAITAPSGFGKTTLVKLLMGLLEPTSGQVLVDGQDLARHSRSSYRARIAGVMQDDALLSGSIVDNITFFDASPDHERARRCARLAAIEEEILTMPMGFESLIGDMGTTLSGGQKQRVLLARALYREPTILFLDEASSHLDARTEQAINRALGRLTITRVIVAHRRETIAMADRLIDLTQAGR